MSEQTPVRQPTLDSLTLDGIVKYIKEGNVKYIVTIAGAGISANTGMPDFRNPDAEMLHKLDKCNLVEPLSAFTLDTFQVDPKPFFTIAKEFYPGSHKPSKSHYFLKLLHDQGLLKRHYTQNVDCLERIAGLPADKLVESHGSFYVGHCVQCMKEFGLTFMKKAIFNDEIPLCDVENCGGVVKPDVVLHGEELPARVVECGQQDFKVCDLLVILGCPLTVMPVAHLLDRVKPEVPRLYINKSYQAGDDPGAEDEESGVLHKLATLFTGSAGGFRWGKKDNKRDVFVQGDCDTVCAKVASKMGFKDKLEHMWKEEDKRMNALLSRHEDLAELCSLGKL